MRLREDDESLNCDFCKTVQLPQRNKDGVGILGEASNLSCPVCAVSLEHAIIDHRRILYCTHCCGSLIPMPTFVSLIDDLRAQQGGAFETPRAPDPQRLRRVIHCPQCKQRMDTHYYGGGGNVVIDDCSRCELNWLDSGELLHIARAPDHSVDHAPGW